MTNAAWLIILCTIITASGCKNNKKETEQAEKYTVTSPLRIDTSVSKEYVAQIQSIKNIEIRAQEKGYLQHMYIDEGRYVKAGQVLFQIMPNIYQAEYLKAQAEVKRAELEWLNAKTLSDNDVVSKSESAIAQAKLDGAKAEMVLAKLHLSLTEIKAPYDGVTDRIPFKIGSLIDEGALLTTLSDNNAVFAYFNVPESEYLAFKSHSDTAVMKLVSLLLANNEMHKYKGNVETIEGQFNNETGNISFRAKFPNPELLLKHGETGKVLMTVPLKHALIIPQKATYELQDKVYLFVIDKDNIVRSRIVTVKNRMTDIYVVSDADLSEGDRILLEGIQKVKDGEKILYEYINPEEVIGHLRLKAE